MVQERKDPFSSEVQFQRSGLATERIRSRIVFATKIN